MKQLLIIITTFSLLIACGFSNKSSIENSKDTKADGFNDYWYQGKAELTSYKLEQARYGEIHDGTAVLVFVTEDFSKKKQVKLDYPSRAGDDAVKVLKLNATRKFNTGIYPYSTMESVFTPVERTKSPKTIKVTASSQEWCGHSFSQLNLSKDSYKAQLNSYFESEGDQEENIPAVLLENELWNLVRINPELLPQGEITILPSLIFQRLKHVELKAIKATAKTIKEGSNSVFILNYPSINRELRITFTTEFPHQINGWEDSYKSGWGASAKILKTKATKMKSILSPYWSKNSVADSYLREELGLDK